MVSGVHPVNGSRYAGEAFLGGFSGQTEHLYFILTEPNSDGEVVIVNVTTHPPVVDRTMALECGDHPFINQTSFLYYRAARMVSMQTINRAREQGLIKPQPKLNDSHLQRIRRGAIESRLTPNKIKNEIRPYLSISI
jgi:hypothetical protein